MLRSDSGMVIAYLKKLFRQLPNTTTRHVILNAVKNLLVTDVRPFAECILSAAEGLRVTSSVASQ